MEEVASRALEVLRSDADIQRALSEGAGMESVPLVREAGHPTKANLSIGSGVLDATDAEAARRKLTRSAMVELMARTTLSKICVDAIRPKSTLTPIATGNPR